MPDMTFAALVLMPFLAFQLILIIAYSFWLKRRGTFSLSRIVVFGASLSTVLGSTLALLALVSYTDLVSSGQEVVVNGAIQPQGWWRVVLVGAFAGVVGVIVAAGLYLLGTLIAANSRGEA